MVIWPSRALFTPNDSGLSWTRNLRANLDLENSLEHGPASRDQVKFIWENGEGCDGVFGTEEMIYIV